MKKTENLPFAEALEIFPSEEAFLKQEPNKTSYYINGNILVRSDSGELLFTEFSEENKEFFVYGSQLEAGNLLPVSDLKDKDREELHRLTQLNYEISQMGIIAVATEKEQRGNEELFFAYLTHPDHSENTYFRIAIPDIIKLNPENVDDLLCYNEERNLDNPYRIQFDGDMMIVY